MPGSTQSSFGNILSIPDIDLDDLLKAARDNLAKSNISVAQSEKTTISLEDLGVVDTTITKETEFQKAKTDLKKLKKLKPQRETITFPYLKIGGERTSIREEQLFGSSSSATKTSATQQPLEQIPTTTTTIGSTMVETKDTKKKEPETLSKWFDMQAPELTDELKRDLHIIKSRNALDPKRFYKKDHRKGLPKFFQIGTVVTSAQDYYSRPTRAERGTTIVEELAKDTERKQYLKKQFLQVQTKKENGSRKWYNSQKAKRRKF